MTTYFNNIRISSILTFDLLHKDFNIDYLKKNSNLEELKKNMINENTKFFDKKPEYVRFQDLENYYDPKYIEKTKILEFFVILDKIDQLDCIKGKYGWSRFLKKVDFSFRIDSGISTIRADFNFEFNHSIDTLKLIKIVREVNGLMDSKIFKDYLLQKFISITKGNFGELNEFENYLTYPVIVSTDNLNLKDRELCGICWRNEKFDIFNDKQVDSILSNDISPYSRSKFVITDVASCLFFPNATKEYIDKRINIIEMFFRQDFLLKRIDDELDELFEDLEKNKNKTSLKKSISKIRKNHYEINENLEIYRNTEFALASMYIMIIDTLTSVFNQNKHYHYIQEKINTCDNVYQGLLNDRQNEIMERIQWIVIIIGVLTLFVGVLTLYDIKLNISSFLQFINGLNFI